MLRDNIKTYNPPLSDDLSVYPKQEVNILLDFIDNNIADFCPYYKTIKDSDKENRISDFLVNHFQLCLRDEQLGGFPPFDFRKNPTQSDSDRETDIGVIVLTKNIKPITIIEFEAKRFSASSNNKEYVCGERGGIERFKRGHHSSHLSICGMFGYVQSRTPSEWIQKVNTWIVELSQTNTNLDIDWNSLDEKLNPINSFQNVEKLKSNHSRKQPSDNILLWHYFINLC